jgi:hypothetical protein
LEQAAVFEQEQPAGAGDDQDPGVLASLLASNGDGEQAGPDTAQVMAGLVGLRRRPVDPMNDYVADGTRELRWVQAAIAHQAALTGQTQQEIKRDALLGVRPISAELLDAHYKDTYGQDRPRHG